MNTINIRKKRTRFGFIGFGLIGGSVARALRDLYPDSEIMAYNYYETKPHEKLEQAKSEGTLTSISTNLEDFSRCQVIFLCAPVLKNVAYLKKLLPHLSPDCILTDVGSVKSDIHREIEKLNLGRQFVGGHPMTGSEKTGYANSDPSFFKGAYYLLTPTPESNPKHVAWMEDFVKSVGSLCMVLDPDNHDRITSGISHGPHVISAALVNTVAERDTQGYYAKLAAGGFHSTTRISSSSPEMWENICQTNREKIVEFLEEYIDTLSKAKEDIISGDSQAITKLFADAKKYRDSIPT